MDKGTLFLIPTSLAEDTAGTVIPEGTLAVVRRLEHFIVEELRTARRFLSKAGTAKPVSELVLSVFNEHSRADDPDQHLAPALSGHDVGLLSEAGAPCVADPGSSIVARAHQHGIRIVPLTGPSSILLALMASGFNGQNFAFLGYLPTDKILRIRRIREIERRMYEADQTQIFIETPYRNLQLFEALVSGCRGETLLCIATDLTGPDEKIQSLSIDDWRHRQPAIHKRPAIFLLYRQGR